MGIDWHFAAGDSSRAVRYYLSDGGSHGDSLLSVAGDFSPSPVDLVEVHVLRSLTSTFNCHWQGEIKNSRKRENS